MASSIGTAIVGDIHLPIHSIALHDGKIKFTVKTQVAKDLTLARGDLVRIFGNDGSSIATYRLMLPQPIQVKANDHVTIYLPLAFASFMGEAAWEGQEV